MGTTLLCAGSQRAVAARMTAWLVGLFLVAHNVGATPEGHGAGMTDEKFVKLSAQDAAANGARFAWIKADLPGAQAAMVVDGQVADRKWDLGSAVDAESGLSCEEGQVWLWRA